MKLPRIHWPSAAALLVLSIAFGLSGASSWLRTHETVPPWPYVPFVLGGMTTWAAMLAPMTVVSNVPDPRAAWRRYAVFNLASFPVFVVVAIGLRRGLCALFWSWLGISSLDVPGLEGLLLELPHTCVLYLAILAFYTAIHALAARRDARRRVAEYSRQLATSRTQTLQARFDPDSVFGTLESLREWMHRDLVRAEELIQELAMNLRSSLAGTPQEVLTNSEEAEFEPSATELPPGRSSWFTLLPAQAAPWRWPRLRLHTSVWALFACVTLVLLQAAITLRVSEEDPRFLFASHLGRAIGIWLGLPVIQTFVFNAPNVWRHYVRCALMFWTGQMAFTLVYSVSMIGARAAATALWPHASPSLELLREFWQVEPTIGATYAGLVALTTATRMWDEQRTEEQRATELGALVAEARLQALSAQLEPHFLYNALNTVSSLMYRDAARTGQLIHNLSDLLRTALDKPRPTWSLAEERAHTARFVSLVEARFGDRISVDWRLPPRVDERISVPRFALQLLVENSVKHNQERRGSLSISIEGGTEAGDLQLAVNDDGEGFNRGSLHGQEAGGGLRRLEQSLHLLYGARARLARVNRERGGARVELNLPVVIES